jgi:hypothetical protein
MYQSGTPLGTQLMTAASDLLFLKDLSLPRIEATGQNHINYLIW